ncbi:hypothetical protein H257_02417 [Aphanomyces astaci]|uniref:EF-hand domain-containing protein n=1 Tax=Aphanomyces astaci TaxID=112090 RepID=W4H3M6_APHAT|nr:hypothetical protein H257_02417 [Aphanomyces astaci]ETV85869.1 hypothetical protein H257_02417 [Aphanomyces astaci]|eukprot:XP_009824341.1 hypothetical protein H257_02417 [Aphanomyces astaci]
MEALTIEVPYVKNAVRFVVEPSLAKEIQTTTIALRKACTLDRIKEDIKAGALLEEDEFVAWIRHCSGIQTDTAFQSTRSMVDLLYHTFAPYSVDMLDLSVGLLVLLDGSVEDKLRLALELSLDDDAFPILTEGAVVRCFTNVLLGLTCLFASGALVNNKDDSNVHSIVEVLQFSAAQTVVELTDHDPTLTFDHVWDWYLLMGSEHAPYLKLLDMSYWRHQEAAASMIHSSMPRSTDPSQASSVLLFPLAHESQSLQIGPAHAMELEELLLASRFTVLQPQAMYDTFLQHTIDGRLDEATFDDALNELTCMACTNHLVDDDKFTASMRMLFRHFQTRTVDAFELAAGFALFCAGSKSDKLAAGFHFFDTDDTGTLTRDQLWRFLRSSLVIMVGLVPPTLSSSSSVLDEIDAAAVEIMQHVDDATYSFDEFGHWYNDGGFHTMSWLELLDLKKWSFVWPGFSHFADEQHQQPAVSASAYYTAKNIRATPYDDRQVDSDDASLTFASHNEDDNGTVSGTRSRQRYATSTCQLDSIPPVCFKNEVVLEFELPLQTTSNDTDAVDDVPAPLDSLCFDNGDLLRYMRLQHCTALHDVDFRAAFCMFESYFSKEGEEEGGGGRGGGRRHPSLDKSDFDLCVGQLLAGLRVPTSVTSTSPPPNHVQLRSNELARHDDDQHHMSHPDDDQTRQEALDMLEALFFAYNRTGTGEIDATEFVSGFVVLCAGSKSDKLSFCFGLFDEDGDGCLTRRDMWKFLRSFLTMLLALGNGADSCAETIGAVCDSACIGIVRSLFDDPPTTLTSGTGPATNDSNPVLKVSFETFAQWYSHHGFQLIPWIELLDTKKWPMVDPTIQLAVQTAPSSEPRRAALVVVHQAEHETVMSFASNESFESVMSASTSTAAVAPPPTTSLSSSSVVFEFKLTSYDDTTLRIRLRDVAVVYTIAEKLRLKSIGVDALYACFDRFAKGKSLTKSGFLHAIRGLAPKGALSSEDQEFLSYHLLRMFTLYESERATSDENDADADNENGGGGMAVDKLHLITGMSVFCHGSKSTKLGVLFSLVEDGGHVSRRALFELFRSILSVLFSFSLGDGSTISSTTSSSSTSNTSSVRANMFAADRAAGALVSKVFCDTQSQGSLSLDTFADWYTSHGGYAMCPWLELLDLSKWPSKRAMEAATREKPLAYAFDMHNEGGLLQYTEKDIATYLAVLEATQFPQLSVHVIHDAIFLASLDGAVVTRSSFYSCIRKLIPRTNVDVHGQQVASRTLARLFSAYDRKKVGKVNALELACGMSLLGRGSKSQKLSTAFELIVQLSQHTSSNWRTHTTTRSPSIPHAMLFLYLRSFLIGLMVLCDARYRRGIELMYIEADELVGDVTTKLLHEISTAAHKSRHRISFEQFGEWYNSGGYEMLSWVELLDVSKWEQQQSPPPLPEDGGGANDTDVTGLLVPVTGSPPSPQVVLEYKVASSVLVFTQTHVDALRECLAHVELHLYSPLQLITVLKTFVQKRQAPSTDLLSPTVKVELTRMQCQRSVLQLCPTHAHCTNRYVGSFVSHLVAVLARSSSDYVPLVHLLCGLLVFTDGNLLEILVHGTALLSYYTLPNASFSEQQGQSDQHVVSWAVLRQCVEIFLRALFACSQSLDPTAAEDDEGDAAAHRVHASAALGAEETVSFFQDVYADDAATVSCEAFHEWFEAEGVKSLPWLSLVVLENWPRSLHLDLTNRRTKTHHL